MTITAEQLRKIAPQASQEAIDKYLPWINQAMQEFDISTARRQASFLATLIHETGQLRSVSENLNYTPAAILATFNTKIRRFTPEQAEQYGRTTAHPANQEMIANIAYANRMGNGDIDSGDGWRHRGAGGIQLTFKSNQQRCADYFGIPIDQIGDWLRSPEGAMRSAGWFWKKNGCNEIADKGNFQGVCGAVNCGSADAPASRIIGLADRTEVFHLARLALSA